MEKTVNYLNTNDHNLPTSQAPDSNMEKINKDKNIMGKLKYCFKALMSALWGGSVDQGRLLPSLKDDLSSVFRTHMVKGKTFHKLSLDLHMCVRVYM